MSVRVKICGLTNAIDAQAAVAAGADALGFMFYEPSPRHLRIDQALSVIQTLPPLVVRVGVFVNPSADYVREAIACGLDVLQFHGEESLQFCRSFGLRAIKAFRIRDAASLSSCTAYSSMAWLLDGYVPGIPGGTGAKFNWDLAVTARQTNPNVILAGGLTPENVAEAVRRVQPIAVDVSSGVESAPGKKDADKIRAFIQAAKKA